jgi:lipid-binding SYLF domain-containing protein
LYGKDITAAKIISESKIEAPPAAHDLIAILQRVSPHPKS